MSTLLNMRANRVVLLSVAAIMVVSLLAPIAAIADTSLAPGDSAVVSSPDGANLRADTSLTDETIIADLPAGTTVWVNEGPYYEDTGVWVYVATDGYGPGFVTTALLSRIGNDELAETNGVPAEEPAAGEEEAEVVSSSYAWLEPIDSLVVVDHDVALTEQGLPVLADAYHGAPVLGYVHVGGGLDVTSERIWEGDSNFVRVNFNGEGAFVDGSFAELASEYVADAPAEEEVIWLDEPTEEPVVEDEVTEEPVVEDEVTEEPVVEDEVTEEPVVEDEVTEEPVVEDAVTEEPVVEDVVTEEPVVEDVVTEEPVVEDEVIEEPVVEDEVTEEPVVEDVVTEEPAVEDEVTEEPVAEEVASPDAGASDETVTEEATETEVATEEVVETEEATEEVVETQVATEETIETEEAAEEVVETEEATVEATEAPQAVQKAPIATTADTFVVEAMIGSATVTGTTSGLLCRTQPAPDAPVLMTLTEGTKVLVSAEPVNGYLGIDCGGLQGFGDVNYLWSGGAGDEEISKSKMSVVVTGTGNGLNCRTGAGLNHSVITTIWDGTSLQTRGAASNGWTPVTCGGQNGFVSTTWIEVASGSGSTGSNNSRNASSGSAVVNTGGDGLYCRSGAGTSYGIITVLRHGTSVSVRGAQQGEWVPVTCGGSAGFAHGSYLNVSSSGSGSDSSDSGTSTPTGSVTVANTGGMGLNCRSGASTSNGVITTLALGQSVQTRSGSTSGWTAVICGGTNGFVSSEFVSGASAGTTPSKPAPSKPAPSPSGMVKGNHGKVTSSLNLRYSASLSSSVSTVVDSGKVVLITGSLSNDFYPVNYDGLTGFMHKDYLTKTNEALSQRGGSGTPSNPAPAPDKPAPKPGNTSPTGDAMVNYAMRYLGYPYVWATRGPASFDCSGFTYWVTLNVTGKNIGAGTWTQVSAGTPVSKANLQPGDLVFFQNTYTAGLSHVGLYIGNGQFIHAQNEETGVVISDLNSSYYGPRWYSAVRL